MGEFNKMEIETKKIILSRIEQMGINYDTLSEKSGVSYHALYRWLKGKTSISYTNLLKIADVLEMDPLFVPRTTLKLKS